MMKQAAIIATVLFAVTFGLTACGETESDARALNSNSKISWKDIEEATKTAGEQDRKLFVYVHTDWCSWCKKMEDETFADDAVAEYMNRNFEPVEIDAESQRQVTFNGRQMTEQEVASTLGVEGFPTHVFMNSAGEPITVAPGYMPPERFIHVLSYIAEDYYQHTDWEEYLNQQEAS